MDRDCAPNILERREILGVGNLFLASFPGRPEMLAEFVDTFDPGVPREEKWVCILSTQSGCPVRCSFCDAASAFRGNLDAREILAQFDFILSLHRELDPSRVGKLKVHFARMGEPALNPETPLALRRLATEHNYPGLIACFVTIAPNSSPARRLLEEILKIKDQHFPYGRFQMQFSVNSTSEQERDRIIPFPKWSMAEISRYGERFYRPRDRKVNLNFALGKGFEFDAGVIARIFDPKCFLIKFTPLNPTRAAASAGLESVLWPGNDEAVSVHRAQLQELGFEVIVSVGTLPEFAAGTNCGQVFSEAVRRLGPRQ